MKAVLTGHSRGLGAAIAAALAARGVPILALARHRNPDLNPDGVEQVEMDLSDADALSAWLESEALARFLDGAEAAVLVNNAGMLQPIGPVGTLEPAAIARAVAVNVAAPMMLTNAFVAASDRLADRRVLHVSSGAARKAYVGWTVYGPTKAALDHHAVNLASEEHAGLRVSSVAPGVIDTDMQAEIRGTDPSRFPARPRFEELKRSGGLISPEDCAARLVDHLLGETFGDAPVIDLRDGG